MIDDATPRLGLPYLAAGQAQKHVTLNEALARLDGLVQMAVESRSLAQQPAAPKSGALYILPPAATGADWGDQAAGTLMRFDSGAWEVLPVGEGAVAWLKDEAALAVLTPAGWSEAGGQAAPASPFGASTVLQIREQELALSGLSVSSQIVIPARSVVLGVSTRTTQAVGGAASYSCGVAGEADKFGSQLGVAVGASNIGVIGPAPFYADTPVVVTAAGGAFTSGRVRLSIHLLAFTAPQEA